MKIISSLIIVFFVIISIVLIRLTRDGISLRTAPIIGASPQDADYRNVAHSVVLRLFPDFQMATHVVIGFPHSSTAAVQILDMMKEEYKKTFNKNVTTVTDNGHLSIDNLKQCPVPCWILTSETKANELTEQPPLPILLDHQISTQHFHLTIIPFLKIDEPPAHCLSEKRLTLDCLIPVSLHETHRKMKKPEIRYFFMRKYKDRDYFLFTQQANDIPLTM